VLTITNVFPNDEGKWGYEARTDLHMDAILSSPWFRVPYPGILLCTFVDFCIFFAFFTGHQHSLLCKPCTSHCD